MIEQPHLWLATRPGGTDPATIRTGPAGDPVGAARWLPGAGLFAAAILSVYEHDEAPLLFRARRAWTFWRRHSVTDADDHLVGHVQAEALLTPAGRPVVWRIPSRGTTGYHIVGGPLLATERTAGASCWLDFGAGEGTENPFLRMLVLAAVLLG